MSRVTFLLIVTSLTLIGTIRASAVKSQNLREVNVSIQVKKALLRNVLDELKRQSGFRFVYTEEIGNIPDISLAAKNKTLYEVLRKIEKEKGLRFEQSGKLIGVLKASSGAGDPSQNPGRISGRVIEEQGIPLAGVSVQAKGKNGTYGANTDADGNYSISVGPGTYTLTVTHITYQAQQVEVSVESERPVTMNFTLKGKEEALNEVVIIGYGAAKRSDLTGAVTDISAEKLRDQPVTSVDQQLVGRIAGVQIQQVSGAPGAGTSVQIRGSGSLGAGNEPLYVIDGMPYASELDQNINPLSFINPADIKSISVLKDASSTAIYGSRGANGVILITTRNAGKAVNEINVSAYVGVSRIPQKGRPEMMNAQEFAIYQRDRIADGIRSRLNREPVESDYPEIYQNVESLGEGTNWYDLILRDAKVQNYSVDLQKSMDRSRFYLGFGYYDQEGVIYNSSFRRYSTSFNYTFNFNDRIQVDASLRPSYVDQNRVESGVSRDDALSIALWAPPVMDAYDSEGNLIPFLQMPTTSYASNPWSFPNPLFMIENISRKYGELRNLGNLSFQWQIIPGLRFRTSLNTIYNTGNYNQFIPSTIGSPNAVPRAGSATASRSRTSGFNWLVENTLNYDKLVGKHSFAVLAGYTTQKSTSRSLGLTAGPFANDLLETINAAPGITNWSEGISEWSMISYLGRVNYTYDDKYLLTATLRSDGSSRFGVNNRFAFFPSAAVAWRISEENFLKDVQAIDQLKVRATYGQSGNNNIGNYAHLSTVNASQHVFNDKTVSASTISLSNPYLGWEESEQIDLGLDLSLLRERISFTADLYRRRSVKMLLNDYIPTITGFSNQLVNKGNVENKGIELALDASPFRGPLTWNVGFNIAFNRNKILSTNDNSDRILSGSVDGRASNISEVGKPIGLFYGFILDGVYSPEDIANPDVAKYPGATAGWPRYRDLNGDGIVSEILDYTALGSPHPKFTYGFSSSLAYRDFDFSVSLNGRKGGYIMNGIRQTTDNMQGLFNVGKEWANRWRSPENPGDGIHAAGPQIVHRVNTLWLEDASFLRITNLTLGYTVPGRLFNAAKRFRLYVTAQNLLTLTKYKGANPEGQASNVNSTLSPGFDTNAYPVARTFTAGFNVKF